MSGSNAPPIPPKRNYKNRLGIHSQHHPELLNSSSSSNHSNQASLVSSVSLPRNLPSNSNGGGVVVGAGFNAVRHNNTNSSNNSNNSGKGGLKSSSSQHHLAVPVTDQDNEEDEQEQIHLRPPVSYNLTKSKSSSNRYPPSTFVDLDADPEDDDDEVDRRGMKQMNINDRDQQKQQSRVPKPPLKPNNSSMKSLKQQQRSSSSLNQYDDEHEHEPEENQMNRKNIKNRSEVKSNSNLIPYDPEVRRNSHSYEDNADYEDVMIEEEVLDFALATSNPDIFIGEDVEIKGDFQYDGILRLDGKFQGKLLTTGDLIVGQKGVLISDISTIQSLWIDGGHVHGDIKVHELYITGNAVVKGDITCKYLHIYSGTATLLGSANVHPNAPEIDNLDTHLQPISIANRNSDNLERKSVKQLVKEKSTQSSSTAIVDPKEAIEKARLAKIAAKERRKAAKELLKKEIESKAQEQAAELERLANEKKAKELKQQEKLIQKQKSKEALEMKLKQQELDKNHSKEQPANSVDSNNAGDKPSSPRTNSPNKVKYAQNVRPIHETELEIKELPPQGTWKISTGNEVEREHNEESEKVAEDKEQQETVHPESQWNMKLHSPSKGESKDKDKDPTENAIPLTTVEESPKVVEDSNEQQFSNVEATESVEPVEPAAKDDSDNNAALTEDKEQSNPEQTLEGNQVPPEESIPEKEEVVSQEAPVEPVVDPNPEVEPPKEEVSTSEQPAGESQNNVGEESVDKNSALAEFNSLQKEAFKGEFPPIDPVVVEEAPVVEATSAEETPAE